MSVTVNLTTAESTAVVHVTTQPALPVTVNALTSAAPVTVAVTMPAPPSLSVNTTLQTHPVAVDFQEARDAYQLAVADGFVGTRAEWLESLRGTPGEPGDPGPAGANAEVVVLRNIPGGATAMAQYIALPPAEQMSGKWFVIAK